MIEELYNKIDKFCNETDWSKYLTYEHALEEFIKEIVEEETKELEKENEELKEDNSEWEKASDKWKSVYELTNNQLTKAKDLLLRFVELKNKPCASGHSINMLLYENICAEAEQFISEVEK